MRMRCYNAVIWIGFVLACIGCERDDICSEGSSSTPDLILRFYDNDNRNLIKKVIELRSRGVGAKTPYMKEDRTNRDSIAIPLKVFDVETQYALIENSGDGSPIESDNSTDTYIPDLGNEDVISITYTVRELFYYRGCGFVGQYDNLKIDIVPDDDNWIKSIEVVSPDKKVEQETKAHVKVYH